MGEAGGIEGLANDSAFARLVASRLVTERFKLVDVGCAGGLAPGWRVFGGRLAAIGFDCNAPEVNRLTREETNPEVRYVTAWVGLPDGHPLKTRIGKKAYWHQWAAMRLAYERTLAARRDRDAGRPPASSETYFRDQVLSQGWATTPPGDLFDIDYAAAFETFAPDQAEIGGAGGPDGADPERTLHLAPYIKSAGFYDADFLKLDIDGPDYEVLRSLGDLLSQRSLLGCSLEVSFFGSHDANDNSFHNVDRLMREKGFDLFSLSVRTYSSAALPFPYLAAQPSQNSGGRAGQGDAVYIRDLGSRVRAADANTLSAEKLAKAAALFALSGLPDYAAEMLIVHRERLAAVLDVDKGLDLLAAEIQGEEIIAESYPDYIAAFEADDPRFYDRAARPSPRTGSAARGSDALISAQHETNAARDALARSEAQLAAVTESTLWRMTAPLRRWITRFRSAR